MSWWHSAREVFQAEWLLLRHHPRFAWAFAGLLVVPSLYALIYLYAMWDPASHTRALPAGLVSLDQGASYRSRELNLGHDVLDAIERQGQFAYRRYDDAETARQHVRQGLLAFMLEIPPDFSRRALPGERAGAAKLTIYTSEGNNYSAAGFARRFAPEVAQRVNTMLGEARWDLVLSTAAGSQRSLETLRAALADLHRGATELQQSLAKAREGSGQLASGSGNAAEAAQRLRSGSQALAEGASQLTEGVRQLGPALRGIEGRRPPEADLATLRQGLRQQLEGQRELVRGLEALSQGTRRLDAGLEQLKTAADDVPLFGGRLVEGIAPLAEGAGQLSQGLDRAREGGTRLVWGAQRIEDSVAALIEGTQRAAGAVNALAGRLPEEARLEQLTEGARELVRGSDVLGQGLRQLGSGSTALQTGLARIAEGAARLDTGLEVLRRSLPHAVDRPDGSAQGLALSVEPEVRVVAPVPNNGVALTPNFVPLALWVGAVMAAFLVHFRRVPEHLVRHPRSALAAGKLVLPMSAVLLQAALMLAMLVGVLHVPLPQPGLFALTLAATSMSFLALVWALVRLVGDLGKVLAVLLFIVQVSAAGALLPIELSDEAFQAMHPYLPLTWVTRAFRVSLFGAYDGEFWSAWAMLCGIGLAALLLGAVVGRWRGVPEGHWRPPLDIE
jgi:putative membrane protein